MVKYLATLLLVPVQLVALCGCDANFDEDGRKHAEQRAKRIERAANRLAAQRDQAARQFRAEEGARIAVANGYVPAGKAKTEADSIDDSDNRSAASPANDQAVPVSPDINPPGI